MRYHSHIFGRAQDAYHSGDQSFLVAPAVKGVDCLWLGVLEGSLRCQAPSLWPPSIRVLGEVDDKCEIVVDSDLAVGPERTGRFPFLEHRWTGDHGARL